MRTTDVFRWSDFLSRYESSEKPVPIQLIATGEAAIPALHAAALDLSRFENVLLKGIIRSWAEVVAAPESLNQLVNSVHGALRHYDLPDLVELAGNGRVKVEQPVDASGRRGAVSAEGVGARFPSERSVFIDETTGRTITRLTNSPAKDNKIYQTHPNWTPDGSSLIFYSDRTGSNEIFALEEATGEIVQITDGDSGSIVVSRHANVLYLVREGEVFRIDLDALLADSRKGAMKKASDYRTSAGRLPEGAKLSGTYTEDANGKALYFGLALGDEGWSIDELELESGAWRRIIDLDFKVGHSQAHPTKSGVISYCHETRGDAPQRMWIVSADGSGNRPFYKETYDEWVTHETWWTEDRMLFNIWPKNDAMKKKPHGIASVSLRNSSLVIHDQYPHWHVCGTTDGKHAVGDTLDGKLFLIDIETGERTLLTAGHRPKGADSHQHQSMSPDGKRVLFVSSMFGNWDLMTVEIAEQLDALVK
jgi:oligogalacturonide lyase